VPAPNILTTVFNAKDMLTASVGRMTKGVFGLGASASVASAQLEREFSKINRRAMEIGMAGTMIGSAITIPLGLAIKAAVDFEKQMGDVETLIDTTKENMGDMGDAVLEMSKKIPKPIADLTKSLYQIRSAGIEASQSMNVLETSGKLAVVGLSTTEESTNALTSAMNTFTAEGKTAQQFASSFFKTVKDGKTTMSGINASFGINAKIMAEAGVKFNDMQAAVAAITITGASASNAYTELSQTISGMMKPSGHLKDIFEQLGVSGDGGFKTLIERAGGLGEALELITEKAKQMNMSLGDDNTLGNEFGNKRAMLGVMAILGTQKKAYHANREDMNSTANDFEAKFSSQSGKAAAQMQIFQNSVTRLSISIGNLLIPALNMLMKAAEPVINGIASFAKKHKTLSKIVVTSIGGVGLLALTIGSIGFAVSTVSRGFLLFKGILVGVNFVQAATTVSFKMLQGYMLGYPAIANNVAKSTLFMKDAFVALNTPITRTLAVLTAIAGVIYFIQKAQQGFFNKDVSKSTATNEMISEKVTGGDDIVKRNTYDINDLEKIKKSGAKTGLLGLPVMTNEDKKIYDSVGKKYEEDINSRGELNLDKANRILNSGDSTLDKSKPMGFNQNMPNPLPSYGSGGGKQEMVITFVNAPAGMTTDIKSNNSANSIIPKVKSTYS